MILKFEVHEWAIMQDFSRSVESDRISEDLLRSCPPNLGILYSDTQRLKDAEAAYTTLARNAAIRTGSVSLITPG